MAASSSSALPKPMLTASSLLFAAATVLLLCCVQASESQGQQARDLLDESSVVLITGAAGFLGSELAMALHRVYRPKKIIAIDSMDDGFSQSKERSAEDLGLFDFKRQRLFHVLQTLGSSCQFYRVDFRPNIPDYQDRGEVPVLDHIFSSNPDITHVVHLADPYGVPSLLEEAEEEKLLNTQAVPRKKDQIKAGMMEAILEQLYKAGKLHPQGRIPHLTYASSAHVYNHYDTSESNPNPPPFAEEKPIATPSSLHGASKLLDEILAKTYSETHNIYSVGLRFFDVYGPWGSPGSLLYDLAERANMGGAFLTEAEELVLDEFTRDYVYIDDAVDAIMTAMQFRPSGSDTSTVPPVVVNVGSGEGTTLRTIVQHMQALLSNTVSFQLPPPRDRHLNELKPSSSIASTSRAKEWLGFESRISLREGLLQLLAWHHDRTSPYGSSTLTVASRARHPMESQGIVSCSPYDSECLKGIPVFPCASECSRAYQCTPSFYDKVLDTTRAWTAACDAVLYTVNLDTDLEAIPSASAVVSTASQSHVTSEEGHCNLAFVSSSSLLVMNLQEQQKQKQAEVDDDAVLKHGFWTLVLIDTDKATHKESFLEFLPKLSPGRFFGGEKTKRIIYCDPDVVIDSIPDLLAEAAMQPLFQPKPTEEADNDKKNQFDSNIEKREGATAMLIGKGRQSHGSRQRHTPVQEAVQDTAYRTVRISIIDQMTGDGFAQPLDSSFIVHTLQSEDSRLFRCDVFGELIQWEVGTDQSAFEFILELHDMWSNVVVRKAGLEPWWAGENVVTIPEKASWAVSTMKRRLQEAKRDLQKNVAADDLPKKDDNAGAQQGKAEIPAAVAATSNRVHLVKVKGKHEESGIDRLESEQVIRSEVNDGRAKKESANSQRGADGSIKENTYKESLKKVDANFGGDDHVSEGQEEGDGAEVMAARAKEDKDDDTTVDDDTIEQADADIPSRPDFETRTRDVSAYDTWMGVLSAASVQYFVRIVPSSEAGVVVLNEYQSQ